jgi:hypothetical protein
MKIIGCDFHPSYQQIAMVDETTGEVTRLRLLHADGEAQRFYESLSLQRQTGLNQMDEVLFGASRRSQPVIEIVVQLLGRGRDNFGRHWDIMPQEIRQIVPLN